MRKLLGNLQIDFRIEKNVVIRVYLHDSVCEKPLSCISIQKKQCNHRMMTMLSSEMQQLDRQSSLNVIGCSCRNS